MSQQNLKTLKEQLDRLGFPSTVNQVEEYIKAGNEKFKAYMFIKSRNDHLMYTLDFEKSNNEWRFNGYNLVKTSIALQKAMVAGIDTEELERRFARADSIYNNYYSGIISKNDASFLQKLEADLMKVFTASTKGMDLASLLMIKHWPESMYTKYLKAGNKLKAKYESSLKVTEASGGLLHAKEAYKRLLIDFCFKVQLKFTLAFTHVLFQIGFKCFTKAHVFDVIRQILKIFIVHKICF